MTFFNGAGGRFDGAAGRAYDRCSPFSQAVYRRVAGFSLPTVNQVSPLDKVTPADKVSSS